MDNFYNSDVQQLFKLLSLENDDNSSEDDCNDTSKDSENSTSKVSYKTPGDCIEEEKSSNSNTENRHDYYERCEKSKDIWCEDEVPELKYDEAKMKESPFYEVIYQQKVAPDDLFLQLGGKGPGSNSCESLIMKIKLDGINSKDEIDLKVCDLSMICRTEKYYLDYNFPKQVDPRQSSANWNQLDNTLIVKVVFDEEHKLDL